MNNLRSVLYWLIVISLIIILWPILKWLILILIVLAIYLFYRLKKNTTIHTFNLHDDFMQDQNEYDNYSRHDIDSDDVIDVEVEVKEEERVEEK